MFNHRKLTPGSHWIRDGVRKTVEPYVMVKSKMSLPAGNETPQSSSPWSSYFNEQVILVPIVLNNCYKQIYHGHMFGILLHFLTHRVNLEEQENLYYVRSIPLNISDR